MLRYLWLAPTCSERLVEKQGMAQPWTLDIWGRISCTQGNTRCCGHAHRVRKSEKHVRKVQEESQKSEAKGAKSQKDRTGPNEVWWTVRLPTYFKRWPTPQLPAPATTVLPTYTKNHEFTSQVHFVSIFLARPPTSTATLLYLFGTIGHHHSIDQNGGSKSMDF